jgi:hypothetical protein
MATPNFIRLIIHFDLMDIMNTVSLRVDNREPGIEVYLSTKPSKERASTPIGWIPTREQNKENIPCISSDTYSSFNYTSSLHFDEILDDFWFVGNEFLLVRTLNGILYIFPMIERSKYTQFEILEMFAGYVGQPLNAIVRVFLNTSLTPIGLTSNKHLRAFNDYNSILIATIEVSAIFWGDLYSFFLHSLSIR